MASLLPDQSLLAIEHSGEHSVK